MISLFCGNVFLMFVMSHSGDIDRDDSECSGVGFPVNRKMQTALVFINQWPSFCKD